MDSTFPLVLVHHVVLHLVLVFANDIPDMVLIAATAELWLDLIVAVPFLNVPKVGGHYPLLINFSMLSLWLCHESSPSYLTCMSSTVSSSAISHSSSSPYSPSNIPSQAIAFGHHVNFLLTLSQSC